MTTEDNNSIIDTSAVDNTTISNGVDVSNVPSTGDISQATTLNSETGNNMEDVSNYAKARMIEQTVTPVQNQDYNPIPLNSSSQSSVVVSSGADNKTPVWFYGLFLIVLFIFIFLSYLIYPLLRNKISIPWLKPLTTVSLTPTAPVLNITPTITPEANDEVLIELNNLNESDEIADLEKDLTNTKLNFLEDDLKDLDNKFNFSSQP